MGSLEALLVQADASRTRPSGILCVLPRLGERTARGDGLQAVLWLGVLMLLFKDRGLTSASGAERAEWAARPTVLLVDAECERIPAPRWWEEEAAARKRQRANGSRRLILFKMHFRNVLYIWSL